MQRLLASICRQNESGPNHGRLTAGTAVLVGLGVLVFVGMVVGVSGGRVAVGVICGTAVGVGTVAVQVGVHRPDVGFRVAVGSTVVGFGV